MPRGVYDRSKAAGKRRFAKIKRGRKKLEKGLELNEKGLTSLIDDTGKIVKANGEIEEACINLRLKGREIKDLVDCLSATIAVYDFKSASSEEEVHLVESAKEIRNKVLCDFVDFAFGKGNYSLGSL